MGNGMASPNDLTGPATVGDFPTDGKADPRMELLYPWVGFAIRGGFFVQFCIAWS